jgi:adenylosuccinate synthase
LRAGDLADPETTSKKLDFLWRVKIDHAEQVVEDNPANKEVNEKFSVLKDIDIEKIANDYFNVFGKITVGKTDRFFSEPTIYEGAQGILLDVERGFHPHVTKTITTFKNAEKLCNTPYEKVGVLRTYITRHGNGPLPTQDDAMGGLFTEDHNGYNLWQGSFRIGWQDLLLAKYGVEISGMPDYIAMTHIDKICSLKKIKISTAYEYSGNGDAGRFFECTKRGKRYTLSSFKQDQVPGHGKEINNILNNCKPIYKLFYHYNEYLKFLESDEGVGVPINILSFGVKASDKKFVGGLK